VITSPLPTFDEVAALPVHADVTVDDGWIDGNGHMNIVYYLQVAFAASAAYMEALGLNDDYREGSKQGVFTAEQHLTYISEMHRGERLTGHVRIADVGPKALHQIVVLLDRTHERVAMVFETMLLHVDLGTRKTTPFPPELRDALADIAGVHAQLSWPAPLCGAIAVR